MKLFLLVFTFLSHFAFFFHIPLGEYEFREEYEDGYYYDFERGRIQYNGFGDLSRGVDYDANLPGDVALLLAEDNRQMNVERVVEESTGTSVKRHPQKVARIRSVFPESWIWTEQWIRYFVQSLIKIGTLAMLSFFLISILSYCRKWLFFPYWLRSVIEHVRIPYIEYCTEL